MNELIKPALNTNNNAGCEYIPFSGFPMKQEIEYGFKIMLPEQDPEKKVTIKELLEINASDLSLLFKKRHNINISSNVIEQHKYPIKLYDYKNNYHYYVGIYTFLLILLQLEGFTWKEIGVLLSRLAIRKLQNEQTIDTKYIIANYNPDSFKVLRANINKIYKLRLPYGQKIRKSKNIKAAIVRRVLLEDINSEYRLMYIKKHKYNDESTSILMFALGQFFKTDTLPCRFDTIKEIIDASFKKMHGASLNQKQIALVSKYTSYNTTRT